MPGMSSTEIIGFMGMVAEALRKLRAELAKAGVDADAVAKDIDGLRERIVVTNEKQESLKRETLVTTAALEKLQKEGYERASGGLDTMIAAVGKTSDDAKNLREMRANVLRPHRSTKDRRPKTE